MTLSTSLFNKGIYKNIISRFKWGSFLYFVILFLSVPFALLVQNTDALTERYINGNYMGLILARGDYAVIPMFLAVVVPTIMAVLACGSVHSQKQGIFLHGLPVTRAEVYVSTLLASFTLMGIPVILNGIILLCMSFSAYGQLIYTWTVFYWIAEYLSVIFIMFSVAMFSAYITGNAAANIAINVLIHILPMLAALAIYLISEVFLFGFVQSDNFIANEIMNNIPIVWLFSRMYKTDMFKEIEMYLYLLGAAAFYVLTYLLYINRKIEACGDVAAFKKFRPILKYTVVMAAAIAIFGILVSANIGAMAKFIVAIVVTLIVYFAAEMLMNKTFKVFGTYKGYLAFWIAGGLFISFFAYTSVFGYETRVPEISDTKEASIYENSYPRIPYVSLPDEISVVHDIHKDIVSNITKDEDPKEYHGIYVRYELKNGKSLVRRYKLSKEKVAEILGKMYDIKNYKLQATRIENLNIENVNKMDINVSMSNFYHQFSINENVPEILYALKKDIEALSYKEIKVEKNALPIHFEVALSAKDNKRLGFFKKVGAGEENAEYYTEDFNLRINSNFESTIAVLKKLGYYDEMMEKMSDCVYICKNSGKYAENILSYKDDKGEVEEFMIAPDDLVKLEKADGRNFAEDMFFEIREEDMEKRNALKEGENYFIFVGDRETKNNIWLSSYVAAYSKDDIPQYLERYVAD